MSQSSNNPLAKHFRQPALYTKLTSTGKFWAGDALVMPESGEIPIYPMTAKDEITLRTPDALINGTSVVEVIESCCPNIKNAWEMPSVDVDSTLIAIRIASYGQNMSISSKCPHCGGEHDYDVDLTKILSGIEMPNYSQTIKHGELVFRLKPMSYKQISKSGNTAFEEEKLISMLADPNIDEEVRKKEYDQHVKKMINLNIENVSNCTDSILLDDGEVVKDPEFIREYYANAESAVIRKVQDKIKDFAKVVGIKPVDTACTDCEKNFKLNIEFDYASFFDQGF